MKKKVCVFCREKIAHDYKDPTCYAKFISDRGKIRARQGDRQLHSASARCRDGREERVKLPCCRTRRPDAKEATTYEMILTQDVTRLGDSGDVVEVKDGYGRNFLVPRGLAIGWSKGAGARSTRSAVRGRPVRFATWTMPVRSNRPSRVCRSTSRHTPETAAGCSDP